MVQTGKGQGLVLKAQKGVVVTDGPWWQEFYSNFPLQMLILHTEAVTHPTGANLLNNSIMTQFLANHFGLSIFLAWHWMKCCLLEIFRSTS